MDIICISYKLCIIVPFFNIRIPMDIYNNYCIKICYLEYILA